MEKTYFIGILLLAMLLTTAIIGCDDDPLSPFQPEITNNPDNFQFQVTDVNGVSTTVTYSWENTGTQASIDQSSAITGGSATINIFDDNSVLVYTRNLSDDGTFPTDPGTTGNWTIEVILTDLVGTVNFRVQKL